MGCLMSKDECNSCKASEYTDLLKETEATTDMHTTDQLIRIDQYNQTTPTLSSGPLPCEPGVSARSSNASQGLPEIKPEMVLASAPPNESFIEKINYSINYTDEIRDRAVRQMCNLHGDKIIVVDNVIKPKPLHSLITTGAVETF